jgi:predicted alpha/beta-fold hydrolase
LRKTTSDPTSIKTGVVFALALFAFVETVAAANASDTGPSRWLSQRLQERRSQGGLSGQGIQKIKLGGLNLAIWQPEQHDKSMPLVIFSHGFRGGHTQSIFLMKDHHIAIRSCTRKRWIRFRFR